MDLGTQFRMLFAKRKIPQCRVATETKISETQMSLLCNGRLILDDNQAKRLADNLKLDLELLKKGKIKEL